jgi:hypothetical protein
VSDYVAPPSERIESYADDSTLLTETDAGSPSTQDRVYSSRIARLSGRIPRGGAERVRLHLAYRSCRWELRDYSFALEAPLVYGHFWRTSEGRHSLGA